MVTTKTILTKKQKQEKIVCLTAYDYPTACIVDGAGIDIILVGDSAANVFAGEKNTLPITMEEMLYHTRIVNHAVKNALLISDMPFLSYQTSIQDAVYNAGRFLKVGAAGVKLEGGAPVIDTIRRLIEIGIPVMGHLGLTPQSLHKFGGYKLQGNTEESKSQLLTDAKLLEKAGCFALVLEKIPTVLAKEITADISIPTIGIGAGPHCDGQILVLHDVIGLFDGFSPKFVKQYANVKEVIEKAIKQYQDEVKKGIYPDKAHSFD
ncbi:MAG: 3-methyl-2-oxobutanoate hydroxymethyltransferase [bacterium]